MSDVETGDDVEFGGGGGEFEGTHQEVTYESWGSRLKSSLGGMCLGFLLFFGSFPLLFWNEGRAVERYDTLEEGQQITTSVLASSIDSTNDGNLVHFTAVVKSASGVNITDPIFGVTTSTDLKLRRSVDMYQWKERVKTKKTKTAGGGTKTTKTYTYYTDWEDYAVQSSNFHSPGGRENPGYMRFDQLTLRADVVTAGEYVLPDDIVDRMSWYVPLTAGVSTQGIPDETLRSEAKPYGNSGFYFGTGNPSSPSVGDTRVVFSSVKPGTITVVARQDGNTFAAYEAEAGGTILLFKEGNHTLAEMYEAAEAENAALTWILRFVGFALMGSGLYLVLRPIEVFADFIPCVGSIVGCGIAFVSFFTAGLLSGLTISIAWLIHHPMIGGIVLAVIVCVTVGIGLLVKHLQKKYKKESSSSSSKLQDGEEHGFQSDDLKLSPEEPTPNNNFGGSGGGVDDIPTTQGYAIDNGPESIPVAQGYVIDSSESGQPARVNGY